MTPGGGSPGGFYAWYGKSRGVKMSRGAGSRAVWRLWAVWWLWAADKTQKFLNLSARFTALDSICEQSLDEHSLESMNEAPGVADRRNL